MTDRKLPPRVGDVCLIGQRIVLVTSASRGGDLVPRCHDGYGQEWRVDGPADDWRVLLQLNDLAAALSQPAALIDTPNGQLVVLPKGFNMRGLEMDTLDETRRYLHLHRMADGWFEGSRSDSVFAALAPFAEAVAAAL